MAHELEEVYAWLEAGEAADYQAGVLVLQKHCKNRSMVNGLLRKESATNREKLRYELVKVGCGGRMEDVSEVLNHFAQAVQGFAQAAQVVSQQVDSALKAAVDQAFPQQPEPEYVPEQLRPELDDLTQLMNKVYQQRCQLSNSLATLDPADGPRVVGEILALEQQYNALAQKRRNLESGQPTAPEQPEPATEPASAEMPAADADQPSIDRAALVQQRGNLRSNLSKARKSAEKAQTEAKRAEYNEKAAKLEIELQQVDMQLKA